MAIKSAYNPPLSDRYRQAELAKIHIAKKEVGLDEDTYRAMLLEIGGAESAGDLNAAGRRAVLDHLKGCGFQGKKSTSPAAKGAWKGYPNRPLNMNKGGSRADQLKKIEALLTIGGLSWNYATAIAKQMRLADKIEWVATEDLYKIITALRKKAQKEGWDLSGEEK